MREIGILQHRALQALKLEEEARRKVSDIEVHTRALLEEQSGGPMNQPNFELNLQKTKAANAVQNLEQQLRHQYMELSSRSHDCEASPIGQLHFFARAHHETLIEGLKTWKN